MCSALIRKRWTGGKGEDQESDLLQVELQDIPVPRSPTSDALLRPFSGNSQQKREQPHPSLRLKDGYSRPVPLTLFPFLPYLLISISFDFYFSSFSDPVCPPFVSLRLGPLFLSLSRISHDMLPSCPNPSPNTTTCDSPKLFKRGL